MTLRSLCSIFTRHAATLQKLLTGALVVLVLGDAIGLYLLMRHNGLLKLTPAEDINAPDVGRQASRLDSEQRAAFLAELNQARLDNFSGEMQVLKTMEWVMNQCSKVELYYGSNPYQALQHARNSGGLSCEPMAGIFKEALTLLGVKARMVLLAVSPLSHYDTHMTVEAFIDGTWRIYDPTFHVSFAHQSKPDRLLNAREISNALRIGTFSDIRPHYYGDVAYPARLGKYYMHYLPLYTNVLVPEEGRISFIQKLPPFRYFYGPSLLYQVKPGDRNAPFFLLMHQELYFLFVFVLPLLIIAVSAAIAVLGLSNRAGCRAATSAYAGARKYKY